MASYTTPTTMFFLPKSWQARSQQIAEMKKQAEAEGKNMSGGGFIILEFWIFLPFFLKDVLFVSFQTVSFNPQNVSGVKSK